MPAALQPAARVYRNLAVQRRLAVCYRLCRLALLVKAYVFHSDDLCYREAIVHFRNINLFCPDMRLLERLFRSDARRLYRCQTFAVCKPYCIACLRAAEYPYRRVGILLRYLSRRQHYRRCPVRYR